LAVVTIPLGAKGADFVVWWEKGFYPQENEAVAEVIAAFEQGSGKEVEIVLHPQADFLDEILGALERPATAGLHLPVVASRLFPAMGSR
jgi:hypothetical protein